MSSAPSAPSAAAAAVIPETCAWKTRRCGVCGAGPEDVSGNPLRCGRHVGDPELPTDLYAVGSNTWRQHQLIQRDLPPEKREWNPDDPEVVAVENARRAEVGVDPIVVGARGDAGDEWTCEPVDRSGPAAYVHLIRGDGDPEESKRGEGTERRARWGIAPHKKLDATVVGTWTGPILKLLREQPGLTFNAISVTLTGLTANVTFETPLDQALWALVDRGLVEHTLRAPIRWRAVSGASHQALEEEPAAEHVSGVVAGRSSGCSGDEGGPHESVQGMADAGPGSRPRGGQGERRVGVARADHAHAAAVGCGQGFRTAVAL